MVLPGVVVPQDQACGPTALAVLVAQGSRAARCRIRATAAPPAALRKFKVATINY